MALNPRAERTILPSGVTVITDHYPIGGGVAARLCVHRGHLHDPAHQNGLAHFAEHMVLHGVPDIPADVLEERFKDAGLIHWNMSTALQRTKYEVAGLTEGATEYLDLIAQSLVACAYDGDDFALEQGRIINEMRRYVANPDLQADYTRDQRVFAGQPHAAWAGDSLITWLGSHLKIYVTITGVPM